MGIDTTADTVAAIAAEIDRWLAECIQQPPLAHNVAAYNQVYAGVGELKTRLGALLGTTAIPITSDGAKPSPPPPSSTKTNGNEE